MRHFPDALDPVEPEGGSRPVGAWKAHRKAQARKRSKSKSKESAGLPKIRESSTRSITNVVKDAISALAPSSTSR